MTKTLHKLLIFTIFMTFFFCGCTEKEFSNDKWRVKLISAEFLSAEKNYDELMVNEAKNLEPLAIHLTLDYIGPTGKISMPEIYIRTGLQTRVRHYSVIGLEKTMDQEKIDLLLHKDYYQEVNAAQNEKIFGEKGCILLFGVKKDITSCSLIIDELPPILIKF